ncbi:hypothetical protein, partial [Paenimyroides tangerinum]|uniref:hypothetical protein n=1 Tax=Paenimyroides tangerinum TaxID=2488728 RepID=UPI00193A8600
MKKNTVANSGLAIWRLKRFYETFVQDSTVVILLNIGAENPPLRILWIKTNFFQVFFLFIYAA